MLTAFGVIGTAHWQQRIWLASDEDIWSSSIPQQQHRWGLVDLLGASRNVQDETTERHAPPRRDDGRDRLGALSSHAAPPAAQNTEGHNNPEADARKRQEQITPAKPHRDNIFKAP